MTGAPGTGTIPAVAEAPFRLEVNGRVVGRWTCSPGETTALAAGWLLAEGFLTPGESPPALEAFEDDGILGIRATLPAHAVTRGEEERRHRAEHGCGPLYFLRCAPRDLVRRPPAPLPDPETLAAQFRDLFAAPERDRDVGGLHVAALSDGRSLRHRVAEIGRHNAVDKAIGLAVLAGDDLAGLGLVLTARISAEIAVKAARAGVGWIASRSVPSTLALRIADHAGVAIVARAAGKEPRVHDPAVHGTGAGAGAARQAGAADADPSATAGLAEEADA
jgi:FdhD protein